jgi:ArsR family transcriptional regulator
MTRQTQKKYNTRAKLIKALAHPTRLFIVEQLSKQKECVCNLTEMVGVDISTISKHLAILKKAGIVENRKEGLQVCYSLKTKCVKKLLNCINHMTVATKPRKG